MFLFARLFNIIISNLPKPDLLVYLHLDIDRLLLNISLRGRSYEQSIQSSYLEVIQQSYFDYIKQQQDIRILVLDVNRIDFVNNPAHYAAIKEVIFQEYTVGIHRIRLG
jgi:deoxyadenosine/deoxycytidine kinase